MTITGAAPAHYDSNFACCGGCSSSEREDAYNGKFATGSLVFIWDIKLKTDPQPVCLVTFPYDPALNEQVGERRVRSGRRVGTSYPIDNDYDYLCCEQRGTCRALNEDASGKCQCVKRWGFTGDHCQNSEIVNDEIFPNSTNMSSVDHLLPDLRSYLLSFDYDSAITSAATSDTSTGFLDVFETGSYRQFGWSGAIFFVLGSAFFAFLLIVHVMWKICFSNCNCRRKRQKIVSGTFMMLFLFVSTATALMTFFVVYNDIKPLSESTNFLSPMDELLANGYRKSNGDSLYLRGIQEHSLTNLEPHIFLDNQSYTEDIIGKPIFHLLDPLTSYSVLYPTTNNDSVDCENMNITQPSVASRMTIGGKTGCFKCKTCLAIADLIADAKNSWRRHIFEVQIDMLTAKNDLKHFSLTSSTLTPSMQKFLDRMHEMCSDSRVVNERLEIAYEAIAGEIKQFSLCGLYVLCVLCKRFCTWNSDG
ncbi:hypothetical protein JG688_00005192 [Phytophthora aleatoria]|uniref:EGF-like domain-containing protein n=1 Tax=Phytophthora aleatoria TaxID=2496075 RepID=A0A8J5IVG8_9STRA|nr:hypothetical protein JG688_00005192 [Phytophthora aleatoria]